MTYVSREKRTGENTAGADGAAVCPFVVLKMMATFCSKMIPSHAPHSLFLEDDGPLLLDDSGMQFLPQTPSPLADGADCHTHLLLLANCPGCMNCEN